MCTRLEYDAYPCSVQHGALPEVRSGLPRDRHATCRLLSASTGYSGEYEFLDFNLLSENADTTLWKHSMPCSRKACVPLRFIRSQMAVCRCARCRGRVSNRLGVQTVLPADLQRMFNKLFAQPTVEIVKRSKRGEKTVNMRELITRSSSLTEQDGQVIAEVVTPLRAIII